MTPDDLNTKLAQRPAMCQGWIAARILGDAAGVVYLSSISEKPERVGTFHLYVWGRAAMRRPDLIRLAARNLMEHYQLDRLVGEIDLHNRMAINLMRRAGVNEIGIVKQRKNDLGGASDILLMDALPGDFNGKLK